MPDEALSGGALPSGWPKSVKLAVLHVISLAQFAIVVARGWAANAINPRARQAAEIDCLTGEVALLKEEIRIKDARLAKIDPRHRPYYPPAERMAILQLRAARGCPMAATENIPRIASDTRAFVTMRDMRVSWDRERWRPARA